MAEGSHAPERTCLACRRKAPQPALVRLVALEGVLHVGLGSGVGRGAYVCPTAACLDAAAGRGRLARALRAEVAVPAAGALAAMVRAAAERKVAALLGQGRRMGCVASGHEATADRVARGQAALLLLTVDAPPEAERLAAAAGAARMPVGRALTRESLGAALGASARWAATVGDRRLAAGIARYLTFIREEGAGGAPEAGVPAGRHGGTRVGGKQGG
jgi:predicted RNA-binding protein YlxR (DUF448 family)